MNHRANLNGIGMTSQRTRERLLGRLMDEGIKNHRVLEVLRTIPRHIFLDEALCHRAYEDVALPIGYGQTISQPFSVARMTEALVDSGPLNNVLEIGTGCGYQTAVIAQLSGKVYSIERIKPLLDRARKNLKLLGIRNVDVRHGDGNEGWSGKGPFDAILTTAAPQQLPQILLSQLADGGRLIIPIGGEQGQELRLVTRRGDEFESKVLSQVRFVPLLQGKIQG